MHAGLKVREGRRHRGADLANLCVGLACVVERDCRIHFAPLDSMMPISHSVTGEPEL